jgi:hypothetical protein|nr:MAG TPA: HICA protein [Caudoviricetes sp.]
MTQTDKLREKFKRIPPPNDLTWPELCRVMSSYGFEWECPGGGSHGAFINNILEVEIKPATKPHGRAEKTIPTYQVRQYKQRLDDLGLL